MSKSIPIIENHFLNFPIDPHCKNCTLRQRHVYKHDVAKVSEFYDGGICEKFSFLSDPAEISFLITQKKVDTLRPSFS